MHAQTSTPSNVNVIAHHKRKGGNAGSVYVCMYCAYSMNRSKEATVYMRMYDWRQSTFDMVQHRKNKWMFSLKERSGCVCIHEFRVLHLPCVCSKYANCGKSVGDMFCFFFMCRPMYQ